MKITRDGKSVVIEARLPLHYRCSLRVFANTPGRVRIRQDGHTPYFMTLETAHELAQVWTAAAQEGYKMLEAAKQTEGG